MSCARLVFAVVFACSSLVRAEPGTIYFKIATLAGQADTWTGALEVGDLSQTIELTDAVALSTSFVGGLSSEPGFTFTSGNDIFVWQGDNETLGANSTVYSTDLVAAVKGGATWESLYGLSFNLLAGVTTDLSVLNPVFLRVSGQAGTIQFSNEPFPVFDPYAEWLTNYPGLTETARLADPDKDGFVNVVEFAFDGEPDVATPEFLQVTAVSNNAVFTFVAYNDLFPDSYAVLSTTNLAATPFAANAGITASISNAPDQAGILFSNSYTRKQFIVPMSLDQFFRVRANVP